MSKSYKKHNLKLKRFERSLYPERYKVVAGVDEAGRGPLAGPVVACAVILKEFSFKTKIFDSKKMSFTARWNAFFEIIKKAHIGVGIIDRKIIDEKNILKATTMAMRKALDNLAIRPEYVLVDGRFKEDDLPYSIRPVTGGDRLCLSIACASIVAKVVRDGLMSCYSILYPQYGFNRNRGYYTREHISAIKRYGLTPIHRRSFRPIQDLIRVNFKF